MSLMTREEQAVDLIHHNSLRMLSELGMAFHSEHALDVLRRGGVRVEGNRAFFTEEQVMSAIDAAQKKFVIHARNSTWDADFNRENLFITPGYGSPSVAELDGTIRTAVLDDFVRLADIVQETAVFSINGGILAQPSDVPASIAAETMVYATLKRSDKVLFSVCDRKKNAENIMKLLEMVFGSIDDYPCSLNLISTLSPLAIAENALDTIEVCAMHGQPVILTPGPMAGGTGPISLAGNASLCNAEILGTNVYTQMVRPGTPMIYGFAPTVSDMRDLSVSNACPGFQKEAHYGALLAKKYGMNFRICGGMSNAGGLTAQAGAESALNLAFSFSEGCNLCMHACGSLHSFGTVSLEKFVFDSEIVDRLCYIYSDLDVSEDALAFDATKEVVEEDIPFMTSNHTFERCRVDPWNWQVSLHGMAHGEPNAELYASITKHMNTLLENHRNPKLLDGVEEAMDSFMLSLGLSQDAVQMISR